LGGGGVSGHWALIGTRAAVCTNDRRTGWRVWVAPGRVRSETCLQGAVRSEGGERVTCSIWNSFTVLWS